MESVTDHQDVIALEIAVALNIFKGVVKHLRIWFAEVDKLSVEDAFHQLSNTSGSDGNVIFSYGVEFITVGYDGRNILLAQQIYNSVDIGIPVEAFVIQENHGGNFIAVFQVDLAYGFAIEISRKDVMSCAFGAEISNRASSYLLLLELRAPR